MHHCSSLRARTGSFPLVTARSREGRQLGRRRFLFPAPLSSRSRPRTREPIASLLPRRAPCFAAFHHPALQLLLDFYCTNSLSFPSRVCVFVLASAWDHAATYKDHTSRSIFPAQLLSRSTRALFFYVSHRDLPPFPLWELNRPPLPRAKCLSLLRNKLPSPHGDQKNL